MKHVPSADRRDHLTTSDDEVTLDDVRRFAALAERTIYPETRRICRNLIAEYYREHPEHAPDCHVATRKGDAA